MEHSINNNPGCFMDVLPGRLRLTTPHLKGNEEMAEEVRSILLKADGITSASVNIATGTLQVDHNEKAITTREILEMLGNENFVCKSLSRNLHNFERTIVETEEEERRRKSSIDSPRRRRSDMEAMRRRFTDASSCYMHALPGRLRLRSDYLKGNEQKSVELRESLLEMKGITSVSVSVATGSIVIHHDEDTITTREVLEILGNKQYRCNFVTMDQILEGAVLEVEKEALKAFFDWMIQTALAAVGARYLSAFI